MGNEAYYDGTLGGLFALLDRLWRGNGVRPRRVGRPPCPFARGTQGLLFGDEPCPGDRSGPDPEGGTPPGGIGGGTLQGGAPSGGEPRPGGIDSGTPPGDAPQGTMSLLPDPGALEGAAGILYQVSAGAYDALVHIWMSALPLEAAALRYALKVLDAAQGAVRAAEPARFAEPGGPADSAGSAGGDPLPWYTREEARRGAEAAAQNRGDEDCEAVLAAAYRVAREIDRLMGFLRFKPDVRGRYVARCAPDYLVLPALAPHFTRRFGDTPWAVIDERRGLALVQEGRGARLAFAGEGRAGEEGRGDPRPSGLRGLDALDPDSRPSDPWEEIWRSYHRAIAIESRKNLRLQRQFIPLRYREYLSEFPSG